MIDKIEEVIKPINKALTIAYGNYDPEIDYEYTDCLLVILFNYTYKNFRVTKEMTKCYANSTKSFDGLVDDVMNDIVTFAINGAFRDILSKSHLVDLYSATKIEMIPK